jgi:hypothetical protein
LQFHQQGKLPLHWMRQFPSQNYISHHVGGHSLMWGKIEYTGNHGVVFPGFCVPNSIKTHKCTHWLPRASKWPRECTSCWQRNEFTLIREIHWHTQCVVKECLIFPSQWNCNHLSSEHQLWGTPETMEYHGALRKDIHFYKDSLTDKHYTFHLWNWTHKVRVTQGCSSKWLQELT